MRRAAVLALVAGALVVVALLLVALWLDLAPEVVR